MFNLAELVGTENLDKITITSKDAYLSNGIILFTGEQKPDSLRYSYDTGFYTNTVIGDDVHTSYYKKVAALMEVTINFTSEAILPDDSPALSANPAKASANGSSSGAETAASYAVAPSGKSAVYTGTADKKAASVRVPDTVVLSGVTYKVTEISDKAFANCKNLKSVTIGKNVTAIGANAFAKCKKLTKITLPAQIKKIGKGAFAGCGKLKTITIKSTKLTSKNVGAKAFKGISSKATAKVPKSKKKAYAKLLKAKGAGKKVKIK